VGVSRPTAVLAGWFGSLRLAEPPGDAYDLKLSFLLGPRCGWTRELFRSK